MRLKPSLLLTARHRFRAERVRRRDQGHAHRLFGLEGPVRESCSEIKLLSALASSCPAQRKPLSAKFCEKQRVASAEVAIYMERERLFLSGLRVCWRCRKILFCQLALPNYPAGSAC